MIITIITGQLLDLLLQELFLAVSHFTSLETDDRFKYCLVL
jgi:hypothetical protein